MTHDPRRAIVAESAEGTMSDVPTTPTPPDVFADGVAVGSGPYGLTLTFFASEPLRASEDPGVPGKVTAHVRMSAQLAGALVESLTTTLKVIPEGRIQVDWKPQE